MAQHCASSPALNAPARDCSSSRVMEEIRCHRCSYFIGEAPGPLEFVGVVKGRRQREQITLPRLCWRCKCGWFNVYRPTS